MKKTVNINLGGRPFIIDEDAYKTLDNYLSSIERHFSKSEGFEDILYDIEARIAELFEENDNTGQIITSKKIEEIKSTMGRPQDFGAEEYSEPNNKSTHSNRRLFRDPEDKVIGGVASGLTAYYGMKDTLLIRLLFVLFGLFSIGLIVYVVLWIAIPKAKTSSDFLAMRGEKINIENIAKTVEDGFMDLKNTFDELHNDFKSKIKN